jgi:hypothetical protein
VVDARLRLDQGPGDGDALGDVVERETEDQQRSERRFTGREGDADR